MNNFDSTVKKVLIDASNWHTLGTLQPGQKFEVDNTNFKTPMNYIAKKTFWGDLSADKSPELIERGSVRITTSAYGGITRSVNRVWHGTIAKFEANMEWLSKTIATSNADVLELKELLQQPMPHDLDEVGKKLFAERQLELFDVVNGIRNEIMSCSKLVDNLEVTYANKPERAEKLKTLRQELNELIKLIQYTSIEALSQVPSELFVKPEEVAVDDFAILNRSSSRSDVIILTNRPSVLKGWKERLQKPVDYVEFRETEPRFVAPGSLVADLHRVYSFRIDGESYISKDPANPQQRYKEYYDTVCQKLDKEGADRLFMLLNQNILADAVMASAGAGFSIHNNSFIYDIGLNEEGVVTLKVDLTLERREIKGNYGMGEPVGSFYKIEAVFLKDELGSPDFYEKQDPLPSLLVSELFDVTGFTDEQKQKLAGQS